MNRRRFLAASGAAVTGSRAALAAAQAGRTVKGSGAEAALSATEAAGAPQKAGAAPGGKLPIKKAVYVGMLPEKLSYADRFKLARDAGFEQIECATTEKESEAEEIKKASESAGLPIHSVMNQAHWQFPLSSADPQVVAKSMKGMETSLRNAKLWGATSVLLVPGVMNAQSSYNDVWARSSANIRKLIPLASELKVVIGIENVWNKFLLSPREMASYVDQFQSPYVKAYLDVGNMVLYGFPQDWIRTLGKRIAKVHIKDFRFRKMRAEFCALREGDIKWPEVYKAFADIGYKGTATVELDGGDEAYLREVNRRFDLILAGE